MFGPLTSMYKVGGAIKTFYKIEQYFCARNKLSSAQPLCLMISSTKHKLHADELSHCCW